MKNQIIADLTPENASRVSTVLSKNNPDWGVKKFNYRDGHSKDVHSVGVGSNSSVLFEGDFKFWGVVSLKD